MTRKTHRIRIPTLLASGLLVPALLVCSMFALAPAGNATPPPARLLTAACPTDPLSIDPASDPARLAPARSPSPTAGGSAAAPQSFPDPARIIGYSEDHPPQPGVRDESGPGRSCDAARER